MPVIVVLALAALVVVVVRWSSLSTTHRLSFIVAAVLIVHMFEEEHLPGGFPCMYNVIVRKSDVPDRYPMSPVIAMAVDVLIWVFLFVPPLFFPHQYWLAMAPMFLAFGELLLHNGIGFGLQPRRGMGFYDPGMVTSWVLGAIGITFVTVLIKDGVMSGWDWLWAFLYFFGCLLLFLIIPENVFSSKTTKWAYDHDDSFLGYYKRYMSVEEVFGSPDTGSTPPPLGPS